MGSQKNYKTIQPQKHVLRIHRRNKHFKFWYVAMLMILKIHFAKSFIITLIFLSPLLFPFTIGKIIRKMDLKLKKMKDVRAFSIRNVFFFGSVFSIALLNYNVGSVTHSIYGESVEILETTGIWMFVLWSGLGDWKNEKKWIEIVELRARIRGYVKAFSSQSIISWIPSWKTLKFRTCIKLISKFGKSKAKFWEILIQTAHPEVLDALGVIKVCSSVSFHEIQHFNIHLKL